MKKYILPMLLMTETAFAERGLNVDVNGFLASTTSTMLSLAKGLVLLGVLLAAIGLSIPGFREPTKHALPWMGLGIALVIITTKFMG